MPQFSRAQDVYQGFNFKKDKQAPVGYITKLVLGDLTLAADQESIRDPENPGSPMADKVVGVLSHYLWETGVTDAMYMSAQISVENKMQLSAKLLGEWTSTEVKFDYVIYEYDPVEKKYYKSNWVGELQGLLEKNGDQLNLTIADDASTEVQSPKNFTLQVGIKPQTEEQEVTLATGVGKNIVKKWGVKAAG